MITFNVVKETHGWSIRMGERMTTPFWSKDQAVRQARLLADAIGRHGQRTEVVIESAAGEEAAPGTGERTLSELDEPPRRRLAGLA